MTDRRLVYCPTCGIVRYVEKSIVAPTCLTCMGTLTSEPMGYTRILLKEIDDDRS